MRAIDNRFVVDHFCERSAHAHADIIVHARKKTKGEWIFEREGDNWLVRKA